jgi:hypothetical protein
MQFEEVYLQALREFVALTGADAGSLEVGSEVSFEFDGMLAFIFMHPVNEEAVIDVEIMQLQEPQSEPANLERMLLLHQLNSITRFTHGAQAMVSVDNMLMLSQALPVPGLNGPQLAEQMGQLLDTAADLRTAWDNLRALIAQTGEAMTPSASTAPTVPLIAPSHFA